MKKLILLSFLISTSVFAISAKQALIQNAINRHEKNILAALKKKGASQDEIFRTYVLAANEMKAYSAFKFARQFYYKAIDLEGVTVDKSRLFFSLINMDLLEGKSAKEHFDELLTYQKKNKISDKKFIRITTNYYRVLISGKTSKEVLNTTQRKDIEKDTTYLVPLKWHDIHTYVQKKKFSEAMKLISTMDMKQAPINQKIISDLITVKTETKKEKTNPLHCEPQYKKYPGSHEQSYTMKMCKILLDERYGKDLNPIDVDKLAKLIDKKAPTQKFLLDALR